LNNDLFLPGLANTEPAADEERTSDDFGQSGKELEAKLKKLPTRSYDYAPFQGTVWRDQGQRLLVNTAGDLEALLQRFHASGRQCIAVDTETTGLSEWQDRTVGVSLSWEPYTGYYIPMRHRTYEQNVEPRAVTALLNRYLEGRRALFFNSEFDIAFLRNDGLTVLDKPGGRNDLLMSGWEDVQILCFLYEPNFNRPSLKGMTTYVLGYKTVSYEEVATGKENPTKTDRKKMRTMDIIEPEEVVDYAATDAIMTLLLWNRLWQPVLEEWGENRVYKVLKHSLIRKRQMQYTVFPVDVQRIRSMRRELQARTKATEDETIRLAGGERLNLNSQRQLVDVLSRHGVPLTNRTKLGQLQTSEDALKPFRKEFPLVASVLDYHGLVKEAGFLDALETYRPTAVAAGDDNLLNYLPFTPAPGVDRSFEGYVVPYYNNVRTCTLRFSSGTGNKDRRMPWTPINVQQLPKPEMEDVRLVTLPPSLGMVDGRDAEGRAVKSPLPWLTHIEGTLHACHRRDARDAGKVFDCQGCEFRAKCTLVKDRVEFPAAQDLNYRSVFTPYPGHRLLSADYKMQEIALAILLSQEPIWLKAMDDGLDLHRITASAALHVDYEKVTKQQRNFIKSTTFALLYGSHGFSVGRNLDISTEEGQRLVNQVLTGLPTLATWMESCVARMRATGYIENVFGYRRPMTWWTSNPAPSIRKRADRMAVNTLIQSSCACVMRVSLSRLYRLIGEHGLEGRVLPLSTVHDEINVSVARGLEDQVMGLMREAMVDWQLPGLPEPMRARRLQVDFKAGPNWGHLLPLDVAKRPW
jgi:DNA polymerase I-like protein with 3'-5' exonuclease and polymerase domains